MVAAVLPLAAGAQGPVDDIVEMVSGEPRVRLYRTDDGIIFKGRPCSAVSLERVGPVMDTLQRASLRAPGQLVRRLQSLICKAMNGVRQEEVARFYPARMPRGVSVYQGMQLLGAWDCPAEGKEEERKEIRFQDLSGRLPTVIRFRLLGPSTVEVWIAPFLKGPSSAEMLRVSYSEDRGWRVIAECFSVRI